MKSLIVSLFICLSILSSSKAYAQTVYCTNCASFWTQALQQAEAVNTTIQTTINTTFGTILGPIANALITDLLQTLTQSTLRWVANGFQGGGPAYILNPKAYFNNIANRAIERQLYSIQVGNNIFGNGIIGSVIQSVRTGKAPTSAQLQYSLGTTIQGSVCTEANITNLATQYVDGNLTAGSNSGSRQARINAQKNIYYQQLCNASAVKGAQQQQLLTNAFSNNFAVGGWGAWLDLSTNPNNTAFGAATKASQIIATDVNTQQTFSKDELVNGLMPKKKCKREAINDEDGSTYCAEEETEVPAASVNNQLQIAQNIGPMKAAFTNTSGISGMLQNFLQQSITTLFYKSFQSRPTTASGINSTGVTQVNVSQSGNGTYNVNTAGSIFTTDTSVNGGGSLFTGSAGDEGGGEPLLGVLNTLKTSLTDIKSYSFEIIDVITSYNNDLRALGACYDSLASKNPSMAGRPEVASGRQYIASKLDANSGLLANAQLDNNAVLPMIDMVSGFITYLQTNTGIGAVSSIAAQYEKATTDGSLFDKSKEVSLKQEQDVVGKAIDADTTANLDPRLAQCRTWAAATQ